MAADHRQRHTGEEAAQCRFRRVEVGVGIEPDRAAARVVEAGDDTQGGVARASEDDGKLPRIDGLADDGSKLLVHARCRGGGVAKWLASVDTWPGCHITNLLDRAAYRGITPRYQGSR